MDKTVDYIIAFLVCTTKRVVVLSKRSADATACLVFFAFMVCAEEIIRIKYGNKHTTVQGRFGAVERPMAPSREGGVLIPAAAGTFLCSFF
jgi:hypothetical protein